MIVFCASYNETTLDGLHLVTVWEGDTVICRGFIEKTTDRLFDMTLTAARIRTAKMLCESVADLEAEIVTKIRERIAILKAATK
jgi:hypothetical protein